MTESSRNGNSLGTPSRALPAPSIRKVGRGSASLPPKPSRVPDPAEPAPHGRTRSGPRTRGRRPGPGTPRRPPHRRSARGGRNLRLGHRARHGHRRATRCAPRPSRPRGGAGLSHAGSRRTARRRDAQRRSASGRSPSRARRPDRRGPHAGTRDHRSHPQPGGRAEHDPRTGRARYGVDRARHPDHATVRLPEGRRQQPGHPGGAAPLAHPGGRDGAPRNAGGRRPRHLPRTNTKRRPAARPAPVSPSSPRRAAPRRSSPPAVRAKRGATAATTSTSSASTSPDPARTA